jgi:release factor glutamine methyltransferase
VARIVGRKEFWGLTLQLDAATLVPRPETETVVEAALAGMQARAGDALRIADLGTGSGALLLALLMELSHAWGVGTDISPAAIEVARRNAAAHGMAGRAGFVVCDLAAALHGLFDLIVSNPPYVASEEIDGLAPEVREYDPRCALDGGADGLACYRAIARQTPALLAPGGRLVLEIGASQAPAVQDLLQAAGLCQVHMVKDLAGLARALVAEAPGHA